MSRKMKDSGIEWIGEVPEEWEAHRLKSLFESRDGGAWGEEKKEDSNDRICIRVADFDFDIQKVKDRDLTYRNYTSDLISRLTLVEGDILLEKSGGGEKTPVGRTINFYENHSCVYSNFIERLRPRKYNCNRLIAYYLKALYQSTYMAVYIKQTIGIQNLDIGSMLYERVVIPEVDVQYRIAGYLDKKCAQIDRLITIQEEMINELKAYKQSVITEAVTKGLDPNAPMKDSGVEWIGEIPYDWEVKRLKNIIDGNFNYGANENGIGYDVSLPRYIRITDISDNSLKDNIEKQSLTEDVAANYILSHEDILFARSGATVGKTFIYLSEYGRCAYAGYLIRARINKMNCPKYVYYYTQSSSYIEWKNQIFIQATIQNISANKYAQLLLSLPKLQIQKAIVQFLNTKCNKIDLLISLKQSKIDTLKEYKKSLIYECVTGKREVS
jgi:type I restriction enzyme, S subunit